ncbi:MAG: hypothetical protein JWO58_2163 [Chitinophagaceae bacterium]|nr:hypothetical protein [Chitinophagaceae bacterium]
MRVLSKLKNILLPILLIALHYTCFAGTTFTVNSLLDPGTGAGTTGSLRYCITTANATAGATAAAPHIIQFLAAGTGSITLGSNLPIFTTPIFIDGGTTSPAYTFWNPKIQLIGFSMVFNAPAASGSHLKGIVFSNANPHAIDISGGVNNLLIEECFIGTDLTGSVDMGAAAHGIICQNSTGLTVKNCIVSGHGAHGVLASSSANLTVIGNIIGLNKAGTAAITNGSFGVLLVDATSSAKIGGLTGGATDSMNVISGNGSIGLALQGTAKNNIRIVRNYIGLNKAGTAAIGNGNVGIQDAGTTTKLLVKSNVVSGNAVQGMYFLSTVSLVIQSNLAGTDAAGLNSVPNGSNNMDLNSITGAIIGGTNVGDGNISSGTSGTGGNHGLLLETCDNSIVKGNYFGPNINGTLISGGGNHGYGIVVKGNNNIIGGTAAGEPNIISGNSQWGVLLTNGNANQVIGNKIGVDKTNASLGNGYGGIVIRRENPPTSINHIIKNNIIAYNGSTYPTNPSSAAWIAPNKGPGIGVGVAEYGTSNTDAYQNLIKDNSIYCNAGLGINLNKQETTPGYGNINKASPFYNVASTNTFSFGTAAPGDVVQVFANPTACSCQGEVLLGTVTADGAGNWSLTHASANPYTNTATGTDAVNNTSEFSVCRDPTLPVDFTSFRVYHKGSEQAGLEWNVALEINNDYFTIEKSDDGVHFTSIGTVKGAGNSPSAKTYSYTDYQYTSSAYYRIRQTDYDGKSSYTRMRYLGLDADSKLLVFPNPATDELSLSWSLSKDSKVTVVLMNALSQVVSEQTYDNADGFFEQRMDISFLPAGVYIVNVTTADQSTSVKIIKK